MTTPDKEGLDTVSLDGLLSSLGGVEGSIMSRPKSMNTMKHGKSRDYAPVGHEVSGSQVKGPTPVLEQRQEEQGVYHFDVEALLKHEGEEGEGKEEGDIVVAEKDCKDSGDEFETIALKDSDDFLLLGEFKHTGSGNNHDHHVSNENVSLSQAVVVDDGGVGTSGGNSLPVFDCLDSRMPNYPAVKMHTEVYEAQRTQETVERGHDGEENHDHGTVSEIGQRAAKVLQVGKKWLFNTSKNIARDVQSRIDARASRRKHRRQTSIIDYPMSDFVPEEHHRMWAEQLKNMPPETQVAALDAMEEYDRLAVQHVIDEMIWYDKHNETPRQDAVEDALNASAMGPPEYDDVLREQKGTPRAVEETFDLLNLDGNPQHNDTHLDTNWENTLFGSHEQDASIVQTHSSQSASIGEEPEIRRKLRDQRLAREQQRVDEQVASVRHAEARETSEKEEKVLIRNRLRPEIDAWCAGKKDNIRSLLCTMDRVMWKESTWKSPSVADLIEPSKVRKWYMKANLVVHPDKVKQSHGTLEQLTRAEMIFDVLQHAWAKFS